MAIAGNCPMPKIIDLHIAAIGGAWLPWMLVFKAEMAIIGSVVGHHYARRVWCSYTWSKLTPDSTIV